MLWLFVHQANKTTPMSEQANFSLFFYLLEKSLWKYDSLIGNTKNGIIKSVKTTVD